jgi:hypothetical protein
VTSKTGAGDATEDLFASIGIDIEVWGRMEEAVLEPSGTTSALGPKQSIVPLKKNRRAEAKGQVR